MKKIIVFLSALLIAPSAFAIIYSEDMSNPEYLQNRGYSQSMIKAVDTKKSHMTGSTGTYEKYYSKPSAFEEKPSNPLEYVSNWYRKAKIYLDPIQDDGHFTERETTFTNDWFMEQPRHKNVENL